MVIPSAEEQFRANVKKMSKAPLKDLSLEEMTREERIWLGRCAKELDRALRAYYNQHQANGCECELCKNAEHALASETFVR